MNPIKMNYSNFTIFILLFVKNKYSISFDGCAKLDKNQLRVLSIK
jgi:hypothetical protein